MFDHKREVPPEWQRNLEEVIPRTEKLPWLKIVWQAGLSPRDTNTHDYEVQRYEVYEVVPQVKIPFDILAELRGPDPRTLGQFVEDTEHRFEGRRVWESWCNISRTQWDIFQETGCWSQRFWIIQGSHGGHVWTLSRTEKSFLKAMGLVYDTPLPGDLPFAEYTELTRSKMVECDRLRKWRHALDWSERSASKTEAGVWVVRDREREEAEWNERMLRYLTNEVEEVVSDMPRTIVNEIMMGNDGAPRGVFDNINEEALDEELFGAGSR